MGKGSPRGVQGPDVTLHSCSQPITLGRPGVSLWYPPARLSLQDSDGGGGGKVGGNLVLNKRGTSRKKRVGF